MELARSLADLAPALAHALRSARSAAVAGLWLHAIAGIKALTGINALALAQQLPAEAALAISRASSLVLGPGAAVVEGLCSPRPEPAASRRRCVPPS